MALLFGAPLFRLVMSPQRTEGGEPRGRPIEHSIEPWAAAAALLSALGWFVGVAATMTGSWSDVLAPDSLGVVAFDTRFGRLWIARVIGIAAVLAIYALAKPSRARDIALVILSGAVAASL